MLCSWPKCGAVIPARDADSALRLGSQQGPRGFEAYCAAHYDAEKSARRPKASSGKLRGKHETGRGEAA